MTDRVVLLSGGMDSAACLLWAVDKSPVVHPLFVYYGQTNWWEERKAARVVAKAAATYGKWIRCDVRPLEVLSLPRIATLPDTVYVPARNIMLIAHGAAHAEATGSKSVVFGAVAFAPEEDKRDPMPDASPEAVAAMSEATRVSTRGKVCVEAPFVRKTKHAVHKFIESRVAGLAKKTWSCYGADSKPCGTCLACLSRSIVEGKRARK